MYCVVYTDRAGRRRRLLVAGSLSLERLLDTICRQNHCAREDIQVTVCGDGPG